MRTRDFGRSLPHSGPSLPDAAGALGGGSAHAEIHGRSSAAVRPDHAFQCGVADDIGRRALLRGLGRLPIVGSCFARFTCTSNCRPPAALCLSSRSVGLSAQAQEQVQGPSRQPAVACPGPRLQKPQRPPIPSQVSTGPACTNYRRNVSIWQSALGCSWASPRTFDTVPTPIKIRTTC